MPRNFANSYTEGIEEIDGETVYWAGVEMAPRLNESTDVTEEEYRIIEEYEEARERQAKAQAAAELRWKKPEPPPPPREPEEIPPTGKLSARQEEFAHYYAAQPVAMRAAALAGYAEEFANNQGYRLLKNPLVLDRIAQLRAERSLVYTLERDTMHDKLEALFFDALSDRNHAAAVAAIRLQARLAGMLMRTTKEDIAARKRRAKRRRKTTNDDK